MKDRTKDDFRVSDLIFLWSQTEVWRPVLGWPNYNVSSWGRVQGPRALLAPTTTHGYHIVSLVRDGITTNRRVHQLVLESFVGSPPFENALVAHNDGDKTNNRVSNLRWASATENQADRNRHGTGHVRGSNMRWAKLTESDIPTIRSRIAAGEKYDDIARDYGVSKHTICVIKKRRAWRHVPDSFNADGVST